MGPGGPMDCCGQMGPGGMRPGGMMGPGGPDGLLRADGTGRNDEARRPNGARSTLAHHHRAQHPSAVALTSQQERRSMSIGQVSVV